jgi:rhamnose utilization protein RhaD (predicted bifunctional aldolase and dehydrogenase)
MASNLQSLVHLSARLAQNSGLVQAGGGNTSVKEDGTLWVKASGKWLIRAAEEEMFLPVPLADILRHVAQNRDYHGEHLSASGLSLRPSVETAMHAVLPQAVVLHFHSVNTIAWAVRKDAVKTLGSLLDGLRWAWLPYIHPGLPLARAIQELTAGKPDVLVLGNHGLVVAGDSCEAAERTLNEVERRLEGQVRTAPQPPDSPVLKQLADGSEWLLPEDPEVHALGTDRQSCETLAEGTLFPDQCVYVGPAAALIRDGETVAAGVERYIGRLGCQPKVALIEGRGALVSKDLTKGGRELLLCIKRILERIPEGVPVNYLGDVEVARLLNWDAEKYRIAIAREQEALS